MPMEEETLKRQRKILFIVESGGSKEGGGKGQEH